MPAADKEYAVLAYFHAKDPKTGSSVFYHPDGNDGWPGAKATFKGDPSSDRVKSLLEGAGGSSGPLIAEKGSDEAKRASTSSTSTSDKEN